MACCLTLTTSRGVTRSEVRTLPADPDAIRAYRGEEVAHAALEHREDEELRRRRLEEARPPPALSRRSSTEARGAAASGAAGLRFEDMFRLKAGAVVAVTRGTAVFESVRSVMPLLLEPYREDGCQLSF
jgi:hypothetical protein